MQYHLRPFKMFCEYTRVSTSSFLLLIKSLTVRFFTHFSVYESWPWSFLRLGVICMNQLLIKTENIFLFADDATHMTKEIDRLP